MLKALKVVTAQEMARIESLAYADGVSEEQFMEGAGLSIAKRTAEFIEDGQREKKVALIAGKGNNGGDAFAAGCALLDLSYAVTAWHLFPPNACSALCQKMRARFEKKGGIVHTVSNTASIHFEGVILEGLVGTGFRGKAEGILAGAIECVNAARLPVLAIDIPAGVNGSSGEVGSVAIHATQTFFLEFPKLGFFQNDGWNYVGKLISAHFGLDKRYKAKASPSAYLFDTASLALPPMQRTRHKYQAGYVLAFAGSKHMPGAAILSSYGALRGGCGIVRLFHPPRMEAELSNAPYELIKEAWTTQWVSRLREEAKRAKSVLIGPGMGCTASAKQMIKTVLKETALPTVIDADALYFIAHNPAWKLPADSILTPHQGEMQALLSTYETKKGDKVQAFVEAKKITLVLKGAPTFIYHPGSLPVIIGHGDPGMATAGSGDVLTGVLAAMLAQGLDPKTAACVAVTLHAIAGEIAAGFLTSYSMTASDILHFLPMAFSRFTSICGG